MPNQITIITPCCRPDNLQKCYETIDFKYVKQWLIIYDTSNQKTYQHQFTDHPQIKEYEKSGGISGNPQRNMGLKTMEENNETSGFVYFLDDDNIFHPDFWEFLETTKEDYFYTFDQEIYVKNQTNIIRKGNKIQSCCIDTAQYMIPIKFIKNIYWMENEHTADFLFIDEINRKHHSKHIYVPKILCYHNYL